MKKKLTILVLIMSSLLFTATSQTDEFVKKNKEIALSFGVTSSKIKNKNITEDKYKDIDNQNGLNMSFCFNKYVAKRFGFGFGLGYSSYKQVVYQKGKIENFSQRDKDGNLYDQWFDSDMTYTSKLGYIDVPVTLHFLLGNSSKFYGILDIGVINQFLVSGIYTEKGSIENMGVYATGNPYWSDISQNNSYYDYGIDLYDVKKEDYYKTYNLSGHFSLGLAAQMKEHLFLKVQPYVNVGFSDITSKDRKDVQYVNVVNIKSDYEKTKLFAIGINIGFAINIGD